jgi:hypothetical protein
VGAEYDWSPLQDFGAIEDAEEDWGPEPTSGHPDDGRAAPRVPRQRSAPAEDYDRWR